MSRATPTILFTFTHFITIHEIIINIGLIDCLELSQAMLVVLPKTQMYANKLQTVAIIKVNITRANDKIHTHSCDIITETNYYSRSIKHISLLPHRL